MVSYYGQGVRFAENAGLKEANICSVWSMRIYIYVYTRCMVVGGRGPHVEQSVHIIDGVEPSLAPHCLRWAILSPVVVNVCFQQDSPLNSSTGHVTPSSTTAVLIIIRP